MSGKHYSPTSQPGFFAAPCGDRFKPTPRVPDDDMPSLLSFAEAKLAGEAMHDIWLKMVENGVADIGPPLLREDLAWQHMARAAWEEVWAIRRGERGVDDGEGARG